jgi:hypothetical protein
LRLQDFSLAFSFGVAIQGQTCGGRLSCHAFPLCNVMNSSNHATELSLTGKRGKTNAVSLTHYARIESNEFKMTSLVFTDGYMCLFPKQINSSGHWSRLFMSVRSKAPGVFLRRMEKRVDLRITSGSIAGNGLCPEARKRAQ